MPVFGSIVQQPFTYSLNRGSAPVLWPWFPPHDKRLERSLKSCSTGSKCTALFAATTRRNGHKRLPCFADPAHPLLPSDEISLGTHSSLGRSMRRLPVVREKPASVPVDL